ncbi:DNA polymerase iota isoform X2 [Electrophorus electricus]|uniref:DNA polymerase iota isoform X2 n=1 Tax=Electrophorus electricus TaxID=8005 RepID=UPI0015D06C2A|nr:DNA polymerase iota isoform X2 [Electrophorus electricus]
MSRRKTRALRVCCVVSACASRRAGGARDRVILHFDLDCYYAQVEMIRNPALRTKPLGVQQKYIIVTCNYLARELGVTKLMSLKEALERCPQLVIVKGEDLTCYREMSYRVTELLMSYCPLVERLGFDENFVDATELVENRLKDTDISSLSFVGHIYKHDALAVDVQEHARLALGSIIAAEMREALWSRLGLTSCAGIASSKLMAKLVSGTFKPNQQTALLPQSTAELMGSLAGPCKVPGIGYRTGEYTVVSAVTVLGIGYRTGEYAVVSAVTVLGIGYRTGEYAVVSAVTVLGIGYRTGEYAVVSAVTVLGIGYRTGEYAVVSAVTMLGIGYRTGEYAVVSAVTVLGIGYRTGEYAVVSAVTVSGVGYRTGKYAVVSAVTVLGIGYRTGEKLKALGVLSVRALQVAPLFELASEFGEATAKRIQNLAYGIDPSPVTPAGPPQSLSDEDSFRKISTVMEVEGKVRELLSCLMERMRKDGRLPQTLRLTLRRSTALNRWFCRESRQCPIPHHTAHRVVTGCSDAVPQLVSIAMKLFHRLVDVGEGFHLTLLNVCFTNLQAKGSDRNSISSYLTHTPPTAAHTSTQGQDMVGGLSPNGPSSRTQTRTVAGVKDTHKRKELFPHTALSSSFSSPPSSSSEPLGQKSLPQAVQAHTPVPPWRPILEHSDEKRVDPGDSRRASVLEERKGPDLPPHVDPDVFGALPEHIQMELLASFQTGGSVPEDSTEAQGSAHTSRFAEQLTVHPNREGGSRHRESSVSHSNHSMAHNDDFSTEHAQNEELCREGQRSEERHAMEDAAGVPVAQTSHPDIPPNVDPCVFSQLPPDMQAELLADWKQRRPTLKVPSKLATKHSAARAGKPAAKGSQSNSLLKYFKPS